MTEKDECKAIKQLLRTHFKQQRAKIFCPQKNKKIIENIKNSNLYKNAYNIMLFYPIGSEIDLRELLFLDSKEKNFFLPKTIETKIFVCPYVDISSLKEGCYKIKEPCTQPVTPEILDLIIIPALSVDKQKNRLGYGKGCYDRLLNSLNKKIPTLLPIFSELISETILPTDEYDVPVD